MDNTKNDELILKDLSDELNEDLAFKDEIEDISFQKIDQVLIEKDQNIDILEDQTWSKESPIGNFPRGAYSRDLSS